MPGPSNSAALQLVESLARLAGARRAPHRPVRIGQDTSRPHLGGARRAMIVEAEALARGRCASPGATPSIVVEDVRAEAVPEAALFHLFNNVRERGGSLLMTSRSRAEDWRVSLADLRSRLRLATPVALGAPEEGLLRQVLVKLFADRQLFVDKPVIDYLVARMERSLSAAVRLVDALDRAALSAGRRITRPMAAEILAQSPETPEEFADHQ